MSELKLGVIGLDTSHVEAFIKLLNYEDNEHHVPGARIIGAYPGGSQLCAVSRDRVEKFTDAYRNEHKVRIYDSIEALGKDVDGVLLHSVDGRQHREQFEAVSRFGKPVFIDKPLACSFEDSRRIADLATERGVPLMSCSAIRYGAGVAGLLAADERAGSAEVFGPMAILDDYPPYYWYGVHSADVLYSYFGRGCRTAQAIHTEGTDLLVGLWEDGRIGTVRGLRQGAWEFGCTLFTKSGAKHSVAAAAPPSYAMLLQKLIPFFQSGQSPIDLEETVEVMAFLEAAETSLAENGRVVELPS
jgi:hypothetical protein